LAGQGGLDSPVRPDNEDWLDIAQILAQFRSEFYWLLSLGKEWVELADFLQEERSWRRTTLHLLMDQGGDDAQSSLSSLVHFI